MSLSGAQLGTADSLEKLAAVALIDPDAARALLPFAVRDPVGASLVRKHQEAHGQLDRLAAAVDVASLTPRRARNRLRRMRPLYAFLNRSDHAHGDGVPCRDERERRIGPILAELEKLARRPRPERPRPTRPKEETTPMRTDYHKPGGIIEGPHTEPAPATANGHTASAGLPIEVLNEMDDWHRQFLVPNFAAVRAAKCDRLARYLLDRPPAAQRELLARVLYQFGLKLAGRR